VLIALVFILMYSYIKERHRGRKMDAAMPALAYGGGDVMGAMEVAYK